jgi:Rieske Fe-S protein
VPEVRKRTFLAWLIGGVLAAMGAAGLAVFAVFLQAPRSKLPPIPMGRSLADLRDGEVLAITPVAGSGFVMADSGGYNRAGDIAPAAFVVRMCGKLEVLAASCSHLGCMVDFDTARQQFVCPCHASRCAAASSPPSLLLPSMARSCTVRRFTRWPMSAGSLGKS